MIGLIILMEASDMNNICPYTGLRSFTEEESLYFKGRDYQIDQVTSLLEQKKFLMVTGASGEGKSSLVYAGLIPNARAGFFKAKYTNWVVADFRPERNPVGNMAHAISETFGLPKATVETELRRGFSSLVDLYLSSDYYIDEEVETWQNLEETEKRKRKRKASNLMIILDQFEEFFTNPENFHNESPTQDSQIVVNLILETARIAIKRNIPVYVVCTMRSDYIGQCSAFRGLPEYIGFSQFFVPRLKRKDLKQVIEEPAILSGNRISQRLIERLVYDLAEGIDQLPILQHALTQIWLAADMGNEEMDLLHYAKVGGMPANELTEEDQKHFLKWFKTLPVLQRQYYHYPGLHKVIEIHASLLYESAWEHYNQKNPQKPISQEEAKKIIEATFKGLTKIDNSRAVRNRMSLGEITEIVNSPKHDANTVGGILNIFREEGNSFIRPFKTEDSATHGLSEDTVLDITHESLIRNWERLNIWAEEEFDKYSTYLDFKKQLDRWKESGKSKDFLLPIGPLSFFEDWYDSNNPNVGWIKRYSEDKTDKESLDANAGSILFEIKEFLRRSTKNVWFTRTYMKYGTQKIAVFIGILIMVLLSGFYWYDAEQKTNERVLERVRSEAKDLLMSQEVFKGLKAVYLLTEDRYEQGRLIPSLLQMEPKDRIELAIETYTYHIYFDKEKDSESKIELLNFIFDELRSSDQNFDVEFLIPTINKFLIVLLMDNYYVPSNDKFEIINQLNLINKKSIFKLFESESLPTPNLPFEINLAIQHWLLQGKASPEEIDEMLKVISPFESEKGKRAFSVFYPKGSFELNGRLGTDFNNGYHTLASLYAAKGDFDGVIKSFEQLIANGQKEYFELARVFNNHQNILGYFYQYGNRELGKKLSRWLSENTVDNPEVTIYRNTIIRSGYISHLYFGTNVNYLSFRSYRGYIYPNLFFSPREVFVQISEDYESLLNQIKNPDERNFELAIFFKRKAVFNHKYWFDRKMEIDENSLDEWFDQSLSHYSKVSEEFLNDLVASTLPYYGDGVRTMPVSRKELYIYPDYKDGWFSWTYHSDVFYKYLEKKELLSTLFKTAKDLESIHFWIAKAFSFEPYNFPGMTDNHYFLSTETLKRVLAFIENHPEGGVVDKNLFYLVLSNREFSEADTLSGFNYYRKFDQEAINRSSNKYEYLEKTFYLNMMVELCEHLAKNGASHEAVGLAEKFPSEVEMAFPYIRMASGVYQQNADPLTFVYLDSASSKISRLNFDIVPGPLDSRSHYIKVLTTVGSQRVNKLAFEVLKEIPENRQFDAVFEMVAGLAREGNYNRAYAAIPGNLTELQDLQARTLIIWEAVSLREKKDGSLEHEGIAQFLDWLTNYINFVPV
jgi:energy-coupling factor transporter ATP-binding protein EcfA2